MRDFPMAADTPPVAGRIRKALIVDDHPLFCDALSMTLQSAFDVAETVTAPDLTTALDRLAEGGIGLVLLDLNLPDVSGLDGLVQIRGAARGIPLVVVSSITDGALIARCIAAGANGFVPKHSARAIFAEALASIDRGETWVPDGVSLDPRPTGAADGEGDAVEKLSQLTRQQARILQLICEGKLNKQIAYELSIAEATVKAHVTAIMRKLGVHSRTQAVLVAREVSFVNLLQD
ncbi:response regulator [Rhodobacterales bacterium HKCCE2091]|nr:response regulator [Rhodobacterales bacterium HKCCE2091]